MATSNPFSVLQGQEYMSLTTFRKNGQTVPTPVWFAEAGGKLYVKTSPLSGKVKRIHNNPAVTVAACRFNGNVLSPTVEARASILPLARHAEAEQVLNRKYGWKKRLFELTTLFRRAKEKQAAFLEITLA
jgi:PPOX class probable F420-dependent enzyme